jgi:hypothetical protein
MSLSKLVTGLVLFAKNEATNGAGATLTGSTDTIQVAQELPVFNYGFTFDGDRKGAQQTGGNLRRTGPGGRTAEGKVKMECKGSGSALTAGNPVPNLHPFLLASGFTSSFGTGTWTYTPVPISTPDISLALEVYDRGEKLPISGAFCAMTMTANGAEPTYFEFDVKGTAGVIADASVPGRFYNSHTVVPPKNESLGLTIFGTSNLRIRNYSYTHGIEIAPRVDLNASTGHAGFALGRRKPELKITVEAEALSTFDPYAAWVAGTTGSVTFTVGSVTGNKMTFTLPQCQIKTCERGADGPLAIWNLTFAPFTSAPDTDDDVTIAFS